jgi:glyoxylase-like metal-dependent hydrolase (beta-lactamase superfamily II)
MGFKAMLAVVLCLVCGAAAAQALPFTLHSLGEGVYAAIDKGKAGANAGFVIGDDAVAVVDTFDNAAAAGALLAEIRKLTPLPVRYVVNTHYHLDHLGGNAVFQQAGAVLIAQRNVRGWLGDNIKFFGADPKPDKRAMVQALVAPQLLFDGELMIHLGKRRLRLVSLPGHTGGDTVVLVPDAGVLFAGDLFWREAWPNLIDASVPEWIRTLDHLRSDKDLAAARYVPGHGELGNAADVAAFREQLADVWDAVRQRREAGLAGDALVEAALPGLMAKYGRWAFADYFAKPNIKADAAELDGTKRKPVPAAP